MTAVAKINNDDLNSLVRSMTYSRTIDGVTQSFYKFVKMEGGQPVRDESGKVMYEPEIQVGNGRRIDKVFNEENEDSYGYTPSNFELIKKIAHSFGATLVGVTEVKEEWVYQGYLRGVGKTDFEKPKHWKNAIVIAVAYSDIKGVP